MSNKQTPSTVPKFNNSQTCRGAVAQFFIQHLKRHDFTDYINNKLAADFACALAPVLHAQLTGITPTAQAPQPRSAPPAETWRPMETAPLDGTSVRILIKDGEHPLSDDNPSVSLGSYGVAGGSDEDPAWTFAGWCWQQDCYTQGTGTPIGWLPAGPTDGAQAAEPARQALTWPKARDVGRLDDMHPGGHLRVGLDSDNDVFVSVFDGDSSASIEFCNPGGGGGGRSSRTRMALIALMVAMEADNAERPALDWWALRNGAAGTNAGSA